LKSFIFYSTKQSLKSGVSSFINIDCSTSPTPTSPSSPSHSFIPAPSSPCISENTTTSSVLPPLLVKLDDENNLCKSFLQLQENIKPDVKIEKEESITIGIADEKLLMQQINLANLFTSMHKIVSEAYVSYSGNSDYNSLSSSTNQLQQRSNDVEINNIDDDDDGTRLDVASQHFVELKPIILSTPSSSFSTIHRSPPPSNLVFDPEAYCAAVFYLYFNIQYYFS
jgi:hypothetical protein